MPPTSMFAAARDRFATTQPSLIARARGGARDALGELCQAYWQPIYCFFRARGCPPADAEELTQRLFATLVAPGELASFDPERGRFRCWLLGAAWHVMLNDLKRARAPKHGGGWVRIEVDLGGAEEIFQLEARRGLDADRLFDRCWAETVARRVLARVRADCEQEGRGEAYARLAAFVLDDDDPADDRTTGALRVERHRLKKRVRARCLRYLREEIGMTVASPDAIDDEIRVLFDALA
jgi:DNA-directed RNA polymerase specialized sigma24 family protein